VSFAGIACGIVAVVLSALDLSWGFDVPFSPFDAVRLMPVRFAFIGIVFSMRRKKSPILVSVAVCAVIGGCFMHEALLVSYAVWAVIGGCFMHGALSGYSYSYAAFLCMRSEEARGSLISTVIIHSGPNDTDEALQILRKCSSERSFSSALFHIETSHRANLYPFLHEVVARRERYDSGQRLKAIGAIVRVRDLSSVPTLRGIANNSDDSLAGDALSALEALEERSDGKGSEGVGS
jgi:hypothetical protein